MLYTFSAYIEPKTAYWYNTSGLVSGFNPTSKRIVKLPSGFGTAAVITGRIIPGMERTEYIAPTIIAPVLPALAKPSISPFAKR